MCEALLHRQATASQLLPGQLLYRPVIQPLFDLIPVEVTPVGIGYLDHCMTIVSMLSW